MSTVNNISCVVSSFSSFVRRGSARNDARISSAARNDEESASVRSSRSFGSARLGVGGSKVYFAYLKTSFISFSCASSLFVGVIASSLSSSCA